MPATNKNNFIAIAKAFGIILMVIGHAGGPSVVCNFIYTFHMPLFFLCSGYFFKEIINADSLQAFSVKRLKGLYWPYIKWSLLFLLLHNVFCRFNIYNALCAAAPYTLRDFGERTVKALLMTDYELLIRPFWFMKALLLSSLLVAVLSLLRNLYFKKISNEVLLAAMLVLTLLCDLCSLQLPVIGNCSVLTFSATYFYTGMVFRKYEHLIPTAWPTIIVAGLLTFVGSQLLESHINMRRTTVLSLLPYYLTSLAGILFVVSVSKQAEASVSPIKKGLYYIGNHTMPILALNLLALKAGSLLKIWLYDLPVEQLAAYTVIEENNSWFWIVYAALGVCLPLAVNACYNEIVRFIKHNPT